MINNYTVAEYAAEHKISKQAAYKAIRSGKLKTEKIKGVLYIIADTDTQNGCSGSPKAGAAADLPLHGDNPPERDQEEQPPNTQDESSQKDQQSESVIPFLLERIKAQEEQINSLIGMLQEQTQTIKTITESLAVISRGAQQLQAHAEMQLKENITQDAQNVIIQDADPQSNQEIPAEQNQDKITILKRLKEIFTRN